MQKKEIAGVGTVFFERSRRAKHVCITVGPVSGIRVAVPLYVSYSRAEKIVHTKKDWLIKQREKLEQAGFFIQNNSTPHNELDSHAARQKIIRRTHELARQHGFTFNRLTIRNQKTRWGSCSSKNNINLNIKLARLPSPLMDYVILHELVHTRIKNHSRDFWDELAKYVGDLKERKKELKRYHLELL